MLYPNRICDYLFELSQVPFLRGFGMHARPIHPLTLESPFLPVNSSKLWPFRTGSSSALSQVFVAVLATESPRQFNFPQKHIDPHALHRVFVLVARSLASPSPSQRFNQFYENCPVAKAPTPEILASRAALCAATARTLRLALSLLGIPVVDRL